MCKRQPYELNRVGQSTDYAKSLLEDMEKAAFAGIEGKRGKWLGDGWLTVFVKDGELGYNLQGGYPTNIVSRETAIAAIAYK